MKRSYIGDKLIVGQALNLDGYNYYAYVSSGTDSQLIIMREKTDETEYKYYFGAGSNFETLWGQKTLLGYLYPSQLKGSC